MTEAHKKIRVAQSNDLSRQVQTITRGVPVIQHRSDTPDDASMQSTPPSPRPNEASAQIVQATPRAAAQGILAGGQRPAAERLSPHQIFASMDETRLASVQRQAADQHMKDAQDRADNQMSSIPPISCASC